MYCSKCGKQIQDNSKFCSECGNPISNEIEQQKVNDEKITSTSEQPKFIYLNNGISVEDTAKKKRKIRLWMVIVPVVAIPVICFLFLLGLGASIESKENNSNKNIAPYLEYIDNYCEDGTVYLSDALYDNRNEVKFMGIYGEISYAVKDNYVESCTWESVDGYTEDKFRNLVSDLEMYFESDAEQSSHTYVSGKTYRYYWTDPYNNLSVTYVHGTAFQNDFSYKEEGVITIVWESNETTKKTRESGPNTSQEEAKIGVIENINTSNDIPDELMNDEFKNVMDLFSKGFSQSGLDIANATTSDDGENYIFYFKGLEFVGDECDDSHLCPRVIYSKEAVNNNGTPSKIYFGFYNPLKSNGYKETVAMVEDIAEALAISDSGLINNDYNSSSKLAVGEYATFTFPNLNLQLVVSNSDGEVEIEITPIEE